ncbi:MAG: FecCD family ABC transporter permease [Desulfovibrio sp.]|uniref:FecCD family ABC transporter permease n=1 Tax=Desulfovibrio sp. 7SRBS1 TaxID=3378064 RepID=UPI003B4218CE
MSDSLADLADSTRTEQNIRYRRILLALGLLVLVALALALRTGRLDIGTDDMLAGFKVLLTKSTAESTADLSPKALAFMLIRLPRCLLALTVGMGISASGAVYQSVFRNPLVSPDILGVAAGCTFGAALGLILPQVSFSGVRVLAFFGGVAAVFSAVAIARLVSVRMTIILVLAGIIVTAVFSALLMLIKYTADPLNELPALVFWSMGSLSRASWDDMVVILPVTVVGLGIFHLLRYRLDVLSLGDSQAKALGVNPRMYRGLFICLSSLVVAVGVASCGQIAWLGLVVPHLARTVVGPGNLRLIPITVLIGGIFLLLADTVARTALPSELPISIITALAGAPLFAWLLYRNRGAGWL